MSAKHTSTDELKTLSETVEPGSQDEFRMLVQTGKFGPHQEFLTSLLLKKPLDYYALFEYGLQQVTSLSRRPDSELATYFLALSSLTDLPDTLRDLAVDCMLFSENESDIIPYSEAKKLRERYERQAPR